MRGDCIFPVLWDFRNMWSSISLSSLHLSFFLSHSSVPLYKAFLSIGLSILMYLLLCLFTSLDIVCKMFVFSLLINSPVHTHIYILCNGVYISVFLLRLKQTFISLCIDCSYVLATFLSVFHFRHTSLLSFVKISFCLFREFFLQIEKTASL